MEQTENQFQQTVTTDQYQRIMMRFYRSSRIHNDIAVECEKNAQLRWMAPHYFQLANIDRETYDGFAEIVEKKKSEPSQSNPPIQPKKEEESVKPSTPKIIIIVTILLLLFSVPGFVIAQVETTPDPLLLLTTEVPEVAEVAEEPGTVIITTPAPVSTPVQVIDLQQAMTIVSALFALGCVVYIIVRERDFAKAQERFNKVLEDKKLSDEVERGYMHGSMNYRNFIEVFESAAKTIGGLNLLPTPIDSNVDKLAAWLEKISDDKPDADPIPPNPPLPGQTPPLTNFSTDPTGS